MSAWLPIRCVVLPACLLAAVAAGAPLKVEVEGNAVIVRGDVASAVARATRAAEVNALGEALTRLGGDAEAAEALLDAHRAELLASSNVTRQSTDDTVLTVMVSAAIDTDALKRIANLSGKARPAAGARTKLKRVMILASEQLGPNELIAWTDFAYAVGPTSASMSAKTKLLQLIDSTGGLDATMSSIFTDAGFDVVDLKALRGQLSKPSLQVVDLTAPAAQEIARKGDADVVIVVRGRANETYHSVVAESGMYSGAGNVVARAIRVSDGKVLSSTTQQGAKLHLDRQTAQLLALNEAGKLASEELVRKLKSE